MRLAAWNVQGLQHQDSNTNTTQALATPNVLCFVKTLALCTSFGLTDGEMSTKLAHFNNSTRTILGMYRVYVWACTVCMYVL